MNKRFVSYTENLDSQFRALIAMPPLMPTTLPRIICERGIYLFSEGETHLYVGRSNSIRKRLLTHCRPGSRQGEAAFAFRLAREATGHLKATYTSDGSRVTLIANPQFAQAFVDAKARIRNMDVRFVEETEPTKQALLEVYVSVVLQTAYNDFDNH